MGSSLCSRGVSPEQQDRSPHGVQTLVEVVDDSPEAAGGLNDEADEAVKMGWRWGGGGVLINSVNVLKA